MTRLPTWLALLIALPLLAASDAYDAWAAGRPAEALPALHATALSSGRWDAWLDLGLAAEAAGRRGPAVVWLVEAHRRAPHRPEPRLALEALGTPLPSGWLDRIGAAAGPGTGPAALSLALIAGLTFGWALGWRRARGAAAAVAALALALLLPGMIATWVDGRVQRAATAADSALLDASGRTLRPLPAGTLLERASSPAWAGHVAVRLADGSGGWVPAADLIAHP